MLVHLGCAIQVDKTELGHANDGEHEDEEHEEQAERAHRRRRRDQRHEDLLQLLLLLDQSEDTTNSQRPQDRTHDLQLLAHASPVDDQDDERENDNREIEVVPAVLEVQAALGDQLDDGFDGEDDHEGVVDD